MWNGNMWTICCIGPGENCGWIWERISSTTFSVLVNGSPPQLLRASKGLRPKDPLPPLLFMIVAKALRALLMKVKDFGLWPNRGFQRRAKWGRNYSFVYIWYHFVKLSEGGGQHPFFLMVKKVLTSKNSKVFPVIHRFEGQMSLLVERLIVQMCLPSIWPLWNLVVENFEKRLSMWNMQGRITLIKANLSDLMFYYICNISLFNMPKVVEAKSDRIRWNFLSDGKSDRKKKRLMRWRQVIKPNGGQGFRSLVTWRIRIACS